MKIPKRAHVSWKRKDIVVSTSPVILNGLRNLIDLNPDWSVEVSDDADVERYLREHLSASDYALLADRHMVEKVDVWRLLKTYHEGGFYMDIDRYYNIPLSEVIDEETECILPTCVDFDFSQDIMLSVPGNPIHKTAIEFNLERRREGWRNIYFLAPQTYMHAVSTALIGRVVDSNPGPEAFAELRAALLKIPHTKTYREMPPHDTLVFRYDPKTFRKGDGRDKAALYKEYEVPHWTTWEP